MFLYWPDTFNWSWHLLRPIAASVYGGGEFNECYNTAQRIKANDPESWHTEWLRTADHVRELARRAEEAGHIVTAHDHYLRASNYYRWSEAFLDHADARRLPTYDNCVECFQKAGRWFTPALEQVEVPYEKVGAVKRLLRPPEIELAAEEYGAAARLVLAVHEEREGALREALAELGANPLSR